MSRPVPSTEAVEALHGCVEPFGPLDAPATFTSGCSLIRALYESSGRILSPHCVCCQQLTVDRSRTVMPNPTGSLAAIVHGMARRPAPRPGTQGHPFRSSVTVGLRTAARGGLLDSPAA